MKISHQSFPTSKAKAVLFGFGSFHLAAGTDMRTATEMKLEDAKVLLV